MTGKSASTSPPNKGNAAIQFQTGFKIGFKTQPKKGKRSPSSSENEIGTTSLLEKKLEHPPADRICSDLDLGSDLEAGFKTGFKTRFKLDQACGQRLTLPFVRRSDDDASHTRQLRREPETIKHDVLATHQF